MSELDTLVPPELELTLNGETLRLSPLRVGQMPAFLRILAPIMKDLTQDQIDWLELFGERGDDLLSAVGIAINKPRNWVDELAADEAILLAAKVIEVNADFFTKMVIPKLGTLFEHIPGNDKGGSIPSNS